MNLRGMLQSVGFTMISFCGVFEVIVSCTVVRRLHFSLPTSQFKCLILISPHFIVHGIRRLQCRLISTVTFSTGADGIGTNDFCTMELSVPILQRVFLGANWPFYITIKDLMKNV